MAGIPIQPYSTSLRQLRVLSDGTLPTYSSGALDLVPAATPGDIAILRSVSENNVLQLRRVSVSGICDAGGASIDVLIQRSSNAGVGAPTGQVTASHDGSDSSGGGQFATYAANRPSNGNGIDSSRPMIRQGKLTLGTAAAPAAALVFAFGGAAKPPTITSLVEFITINLRGATMPAGTKLHIDIEWTEEYRTRSIIAGDSTTSNANFLWQTLRQSQGIQSQIKLRNHGSNGYRLTDYINNTNGVTYSLSATIGALGEVYGPVNPRLIISYGINDVRTGATTQAQLQAMLETTISTVLAAAPDCRIGLWGPNSLTSDDPGATGFVTLTGIFSGLTLAQAAQQATDIMYGAYETFRDDPRLEFVAQKQDVTGRTVKTVASSGIMTDILHPNARGQKLLARQIHPYLLRT